MRITPRYSLLLLLQQGFSITSTYFVSLFLQLSTASLFTHNQPLLYHVKMRLNLATPSLLSVIAALNLPNGLDQPGEGLLLQDSADDTTLVASRRSEPTACINQAGNGIHVEPDTDASFLASATFSQAATAAGTKPSDRYSVVPGWVDLKASNGDGTGYLGYILSELSDYNPEQCADLCRNWSGSASCASFVIFLERAPELVWPNHQGALRGLPCVC